jgi:uncharacterized protein (DUF1501 family)
MAFRMQASVPELTNCHGRAAVHLRALRRVEARKPGTFAYSALLARRLVERGVRFVQMYLNNWDHHANAGRTPARSQCKDIDQATYGLIQRPSRQRGMLDDTLIIWGGEFGRTIYSQGGLLERELRPRPSSALLHACGWPAAA